MIFSGIAGACVLTLIGFVCGQAYGRGLLPNSAKPPDSKRHPVKRSNWDAGDNIRPKPMVPKSGWSIENGAVSIRKGSITQRVPMETLQPLKPNHAGMHQLELQGTTKDRVLKATPELMIPRRDDPIPEIEIATAATHAAIKPFQTVLEAVPGKRMALPIGDIERSREEG